MKRFQEVRYNKLGFDLVSEGNDHFRFTRKAIIIACNAERIEKLATRLTVAGDGWSYQDAMRALDRFSVNLNAGIYELVFTTPALLKQVKKDGIQIHNLILDQVILGLEDGGILARDLADQLKNDKILVVKMN